MAAQVRYHYSFRPSTPEELAACLADPLWRICSGALYKIMVKSDKDDTGTVQPFKPNRAQRRLISALWHRNVILKARQLGFTTLVALLWLDHALFNADQRCVLVAQDLMKATEIFRDKIKFAYDRLPDEVRAACPVQTESKTELLFANNSAVRVATSARGGTTHRLHISEMGKIGAKFPHKAKEIVTGSFPSVPADGIIVVESTAEGQEGEFFNICKRAEAVQQLGRLLTSKDFRFHFFPWWKELDYRIDADQVMVQVDLDYFSEVEVTMGTTLDRQQRNWYIATRAADFSDNEELMWQEYPSTPEEAFKVSTEGTYYDKQLSSVRKQKRIGFFPHVEGVPVDTFWDIGNSDGTAIWFMQRLGAERRFIDFLEGWGEGYGHYFKEMAEKSYRWGTHHVPHDAEHKRQTGEVILAPIDTMRASKLGGSWFVVPRVEDINHGIQLTRTAFGSATFNESTTKEGLIHLGAYRKEWDENLARWKLKPRKDVHTEAADAFRQYGQTFRAGAPTTAKPAKDRGNWRAR